jgi:hypothetical protein
MISLYQFIPEGCGLFWVAQLRKTNLATTDLPNQRNEI